MKTQDSSQPHAGERRAVVIGASMAGLVAARVLHDHFDRVTVIERDALPAGAEQRKAVPQGHHVHALLMRGEQLLSALFPGLTESLIAAGAVPLDMGREFRWYHFGVWKAAFDSGLTFLSVSRPLLESEVRRRVFALPRVERLDGCEVVELLPRTGPRGVTGVAGVRIRRREESTATDLGAALVVDAGGRGTALPRWLEALGYPRPEESVVKVRVGYASLVHRRAPTARLQAIYVGSTPPNSRLGIQTPIEGDRWMVSLCGLGGDYPPRDLPGMLEFARSLPVPDLYQALRHAEPLEPITVFKYPANVRRHYERLRRFPEGLVVLGDAACSFNPFYGQGMTVAALGATALERCLREQPGPDLDGLSRRFQRGLAALTDAPWAMNIGEDLRFPTVEGKRPALSGVLNRYLSRVHAAVEHDTEVLGLFYRVMHMLEPPTALLRPGVALRVLRARGRAAAPAPAGVGRPA